MALHVWPDGHWSFIFVCYETRCWVGPNSTFLALCIALGRAVQKGAFLWMWHAQIFIYVTHWETSKTLKVFSCYPGKKWRKYPVLNLASKRYHSLENSHRGNFRGKHLDWHLSGASNLREITLTRIRFRNISGTAWEEQWSQGIGVGWWGGPSSGPSPCRPEAAPSKPWCQSWGASFWQCWRA